MREPAGSGVGSSLAVALGLGVVLAAVLVLSGGRAQPLDGEALLGERFELQRLPFGLPVADAQRLPGDEELVQLGDPAELAADAARRAAEPPAAQEPMGRPGGAPGNGPPRGPMGGGGFEPDPVWKTLPEGEAADPFEVSFLWYPRGRSDQVLPKLFGPTHFSDIGALGEKGGTVLIDAGTVDWHGYEVPYRHQRRFRRRDGEPLFEDLLRANLTVGLPACVLVLRWREGEKASRDDLAEALDGLAPKDVPGAAGGHVPR